MAEKEREPCLDARFWARKRHKRRGHSKCTAVRGTSPVTARSTDLYLLARGAGNDRGCFFDGVQKQNSPLVRGTWLCGSTASGIITILSLSCGFFDGGDVRSYSCLVTSAALCSLILLGTSGDKREFICTRHGVLLARLRLYQSVLTSVAPASLIRGTGQGTWAYSSASPVGRLIRSLGEIVDHELISLVSPFIQAPLDFLESEPCSLHRLRQLAATCCNCCMGQ